MLRPWAQWLIDRRCRWLVIVLWLLAAGPAALRYMLVWAWVEVRDELLPAMAREWRDLLRAPATKGKEGASHG